MMKKLRARLADHLTLAKFQDAHTRASKSKGLRSEVLAFNINKIGNLISIMNTIGAGLYRASEYRRFWIYDPKKRLILALPIDVFVLPERSNDNGQDQDRLIVPTARVVVWAYITEPSHP